MGLDASFAVVGWIVTVILTGCSAYFGAYLGKRAERRAIEETLNKVERRVADISEAARVRWSKRSEISAILYGRMVKVVRAFRNYLHSSTESTPEEVEKLREVCRSFDDYAGEHALFLPLETKERVQHIADQLLRAFAITTVLPSASDRDERREHYELKSMSLRRFSESGDLTKEIAEVEAQLRSVLEA